MTLLYDYNTTRVTAFCPHCHQITELNVGLSYNTMTSAGPVTVRPDPLRFWCENCQLEMIPADPKIIRQILRLNELGYLTKASCQGHVRWMMVPGPEGMYTTNAIVLPYVLFRTTTEFPPKAIQYLNNTDSCFEGCFVPIEERGLFWTRKRPCFQIKVKDDLIPKSLFFEDEEDAKALLQNWDLAACLDRFIERLESLILE